MPSPADPARPPATHRLVLDLSTKTAHVLDRDGRSLAAWSGVSRGTVGCRIVLDGWLFAGDPAEPWKLTSPPDGFETGVRRNPEYWRAFAGWCAGPDRHVHRAVRAPEEVPCSPDEPYIMTICRCGAVARLDGVPLAVADVAETTELVEYGLFRPDGACVRRTYSNPASARARARRVNLDTAEVLAVAALCPGHLDPATGKRVVEADAGRPWCPTCLAYGDRAALTVAVHPAPQPVKLTIRENPWPS